MSEPEIHSDPFSAADEAFFQAGMHSEHEAISERPVTLEQEPVGEVPFGAGEARRARFVRPVASTLVGLSALLLVGLVRHALRSEAVELELARPAIARAMTTAQPITAAQPARDLAPALADDAADDSALLQMSTYAEPPPCSAQSSLPDDAEAHSSAVFGPPEATEHSGVSPGDAVVAKGKPLDRRPGRHGAIVTHPRAHGPVTKAALLNAVRPS
jgi:hypothetical protein